ncbi:hypothetical protein K3495_g7493 [Podosphaera aphanis]|nr:hypothetical protein K3495_g7493 [Podosphaera aphanis]
MKGLRAILHLSEEAPLLRADLTSVKAALLDTVPGPKDAITSVSRSSNGFSISFAQTGVTPSGAHWSLHEDHHDPLHTAAIFFPKEVPIFRIVDSAPSPCYIPNPKVVQCDACFGFHQFSRCRNQALCALCGTARHRGDCCHARRCINCLGKHSADDLSCPLRPFKGKLIHPSEKVISELRTRNRNILRKARRAEAAAAAAGSATNPPASSTALTSSTETSTALSQNGPLASHNRFTSLQPVSGGSMEVDLGETVANNAPNLTLHE